MTYKQTKRSLINDFSPHWGRTNATKKKPIDLDGVARIMSSPSKIEPRGLVNSSHELDELIRKVSIKNYTESGGTIKKIPRDVRTKKSWFFRGEYCTIV